MKRRPIPLYGSTDLPVLKLPTAAARAQALGTTTTGFRPLDLITPWTLAVMLVLFGLSIMAGDALAQVANISNRGMPLDAMGVVKALIKWTPLVLFGPPGEVGGMLLNVLISFLAMAIGTVFGLFLGLGQVSRNLFIRWVSWAVTQFFRNSPWLVLLFFAMLLLPFDMRIAGVSIPLPGWLKATIGLALPVLANISELVRGAIVSIPSGQWESAESLAFTRWQTMTMIILPQCVKRMTPPWMNWYALLTMSTPLVSVVGVSDAMTLTQDALAAEGRSALLIPMYFALLVWFFLYCYPIARWTQRMERRFAVVG